MFRVTGTPLGSLELAVHRDSRRPVDRRRAGPKEVATRTGHASVSFALDRFGHLYPEADTALRDRLDALYVAGAQAEPGVVIELRRDASRPQRGPGTG